MDMGQESKTRSKLYHSAPHSKQADVSKPNFHNQTTNFDHPAVDSKSLIFRKKKYCVFTRTGIVSSINHKHGHTYCQLWFCNVGLSASVSVGKHQMEGSKLSQVRSHGMRFQNSGHFPPIFPNFLPTTRRFRSSLDVSE